MKMFRLTVCLTLLSGVLVAKPLSEKPTEKQIPRFSMLADGLYRGGQPDQKGFEFLKRQGFKTVINLRAEDNDEANVVKQLGMNYVQIPIEEPRPWSRIPDSAITKYFALVNDPANYPIFFHCRRGADRTGALAAFYRIGAQGWDAKKAHDEARDIGMRWWYTAIKEQVYDFKPAMTKTNASLPAEAR